MNLDKVIAKRNNKTVYRDGVRCIKVYNAEHPKSDVFNEALNQARIEETGLNVPRVLEVTAIDGKLALVSEYIEGKTLAELMEENPDKKEEYVELLVDLQTSVHEKRAPLLNKLKDKMHRMVCETELDATTRYDLHARLDSMPKHDKVCHGDFNPTNVIIDENGVPYIIDWSHVAQGNASADAASTYLFFRLSGDDALSETYLDVFCKKSGIAKQYVQKWIPIVAAVESVKFDGKEREFFVSMVNVADCK